MEENITEFSLLRESILLIANNVAPPNENVANFFEKVANFLDAKEKSRILEQSIH